jgi:hypothetical protein
MENGERTAHQQCELQITGRRRMRFLLSNAFTLKQTA